MALHAAHRLNKPELIFFFISLIGDQIHHYCILDIFQLYKKKLNRKFDGKLKYYVVFYTYWKCTIDRLWVRSPLEEIKYLFTFIYIFIISLWCLG